ncbi:hypothetical protein [Halosolutus gelatinilyticus]|uniref:hypothetical protein n=1 Tax=Halosolutus gelatinilyticus TaxID=2931975 RepID=UPI001FF29347|nr:hypothetical protein [Halosolutus gelatinilyticus]
MWPTELYTADGGSSIARVGGVDPIETIGSLGPLGRFGLGVAAVVLVAVVVLGLLHGYGNRTVRKCRRSPVISFCFGAPSALVLGLLTAAGVLMLGTEVGVFFGVPLVVLSATVFPTVTAIGLTAIGQSIAARAGQDRLPVGILVGGLLGGVAALSVPTAIVIGGIGAALGTGASVRILLGAGGAADPDERTIPPANQI